MSKGPAGSCRRHRSRSSSRRTAGRDARYAPAGPTPSVNVSHQDSNPAWRTRTVSVVAWTAFQPGLREERGQVTLADAGQARLVVSARIELAHRAPERAQRSAPAGVVPHAGRDQAAGPGDPAHLPQPRHRVSHEVNDQLGQRGVEARIGERQLLGGGLLDVHPGQPIPRRVDERRGRFHRADRVSAGPVHQLGRQRTRPAAHVEYPLAAPDPGQVSELRRERLGVPAHETHVGVRADIKAHQANLPPASASGREHRPVPATWSARRIGVDQRR